MIEYRCACGKSMYWGSGEAPKPCEGCGECGTNFSKKPTAKHEYSTYFIGGNKPNKVARCKVCGHILRCEHGNLPYRCEACATGQE